MDDNNRKIEAKKAKRLKQKPNKSEKGSRIFAIDFDKGFNMGNLSAGATWLLVLIMFFLLAVISLTLIYRLNQEKRELLNRQAELEIILEEVESKSLELDKMEAIADEPEAIEKLAREELGMIRENEILFKDLK